MNSRIHKPRTDLPMNPPEAEPSGEVPEKPPYKSGTFIRVKENHPSSRAGTDGMVIQDMGEEGIGMIFGFDRYNENQHLQCVGTELWQRDELDLESAA